MDVLKFVLLIAAVTPFLTCHGGENHYVTSPDGLPCPANTTCHALSFYTNHSSRYFTSNTIFYFLEGTHTLDSKQGGFVSIKNVSNLTLQGLGKMETGFHASVWQSTVTISCKLTCKGGFYIANSTAVKITQLTIINCGSNSPSTGAIVFDHVFNLTLEKLSVQLSTQFGLVIKASVNISISESSFAANAVPKEQMKLDNNNVEMLKQIGGNLLITVSDVDLKSPMSFVHIQHTNISLANSTGLALIIQQEQYTVTITFNNTKADENHGSNIAIVAFSSLYNIAFESVTSRFANRAKNAGYLHPKATGAGLSFMHIDNKGSENNRGNLVINKSCFQSNKARLGGGMFIYWAENTAATVSIKSCIVVDNEASQVPGVYLWQQAAFQQTLFPEINVNNLTISNSISGFDTSAFTITSVHNISLTNINIINNNCTGLMVVNSQVSINGSHNVLHNNTGVKGGGMALYEGTYLIPLPGTKIAIHQNHASEVGGAIFTKSLHSSFISSGASCFLQFNKNVEVSTDLLDFANNTAVYVGSLLYGGENCIKLDLPIFNVTNYRHTTIPAIASDPVRVCFCSNNSCIETPNITVSAAPGEILTHTVAAMSRWNTMTSAKITMYLATKSGGDGYTLDLDTGASLTINKVECTSVNHTLFLVDETNKEASLLLFLDSESIPLLGASNQLNLQVHVKECPAGFKFSNQTRKCECFPVLNNSLMCTIAEKSFQHSLNIWFGNVSNCTVIPQQCPMDYCKNSAVTFTLSDPDAQCALNRSGVLCGRCTEGLSLMLGSNRCDKCTDSYLFLLLPFALAGFVLVALVMILNLTVSVGTINGLIFFANVLQIYKHAFFTHDPILILSQFISWLNLDLGIETCFYNGMTTCEKTWLQFLFPLYLCTIVSVLWVLCRCSKRVNSRLGSKIVPTFTTILLLSYTRLLLQVVRILHGIQLPCENQATLPLVWYIDANLDYYHPCHATLVVVAIAVLVLYIVPYTATLLLFPVLEPQITKRRCLKFLMLLKPLSDAHIAPFGPKRGFWPGLLLLVRVLFVLIVILTTDYTISFTILECVCPALAIILLRGKIFDRDELNFFNAILMQFMIPLLVSLVRKASPKPPTTNEANSIEVTKHYAYTGEVLVLSISFGAFLVVLGYHMYSCCYKYHCNIGPSKRFALRKRAVTLLKSEIQEAVSIDESDGDTSLAKEEIGNVASSSPSTPYGAALLRKFTIVDGKEGYSKLK